RRQGRRRGPARPLGPPRRPGRWDRARLRRTGPAPCRSQGARRVVARRAFPAVTTHRLFVPPDQLAGSARVKLAPEQSRHLVAVLRLQSGAEIEVFDGRGGRFRAVLAGDELEIREALPSEPSRVDAVLVQALAKGEKMDLVIQKATELGARRERSGGGGSRRKRHGSAAVGTCRASTSLSTGTVSSRSSAPSRSGARCCSILAKARCGSATPRAASPGSCSRSAPKAGSRQR